MIKHIVMWKFKDEAEGRSKQENMELVRDRLYALVPIIPEIKKMEIGFDFSKTPMSYDMMLYTEFESKDDLDVYAVDKDHGKVKVIVAATTEARVVLDYEV